jgi:hypothetical protein
MIGKKWLALRLVPWLLTTALAFTAAVMAAAQDAAHPSAASSCKSIVGSWEVVDDQSGAIFLGTYNGGPSEGTVNFTSPNRATSLTHGVWRRTGPCTVADTDIAFIYDENGNAAFQIKFRAEIELRKNGDTAVFAFEFEVSLLDGTVVNSGTATATGTRIKVEPRRLH